MIDNGDDGVKEQNDCNDNDPSIYTAGPEACDGKDNQCSGDAG